MFMLIRTDVPISSDEETVTFQEEPDLVANEDDNQPQEERSKLLVAQG